MLSMLRLARALQGQHIVLQRKNKVIIFESFSLSLVTVQGSRGENKFNEENKEIFAGLQEGISMKPAAHLQLLQSSGGRIKAQS